MAFSRKMGAFSAAAQPKPKSAAEEAFAGEWLNEDGEVVRIQGKWLKAEDGTDIELTIKNETSCSMRIDGEVYDATLRADGSLLWSDNNVWKRRTGMPKVDASARQEDGDEAARQKQEKARQAAFEAERARKAAARERAIAEREAAAVASAPGAGGGQQPEAAAAQGDGESQAGAQTAMERARQAREAERAKKAAALERLRSERAAAAAAKAASSASPSVVVDSEDVKGMNPELQAAKVRSQASLSKARQAFEAAKAQQVAASAEGSQVHAEERASKAEVADVAPQPQEAESTSKAEDPQRGQGSGDARRDGAAESASVAEEQPPSAPQQEASAAGADVPSASAHKAQETQEKEADPGSREEDPEAAQRRNQAGIDKAKQAFEAEKARKAAALERAQALKAAAAAAAAKAASQASQPSTSGASDLEAAKAKAEAGLEKARQAREAEKARKAAAMERVRAAKAAEEAEASNLGAGSSSSSAPRPEVGGGTKQPPGVDKARLAREAERQRKRAALERVRAQKAAAVAAEDAKYGGSWDDAGGTTQTSQVPSAPVSYGPDSTAGVEDENVDPFAHIVLEPEMVVRVRNLKDSPALNGLLAQIVAKPDSSGRWPVQVEGKGETIFKMKRENLHIISQEEFEAWQAEQAKTQGGGGGGDLISGIDPQEVIRSAISGPAMAAAAKTPQGALLRGPSSEGNPFDIRWENETDADVVSKKVANLLKNQGTCVIETGVDTSVLEGAYSEALKLWKEKAFRPPMEGMGASEVEELLWPAVLYKDEEAVMWVSEGPRLKQMQNLQVLCESVAGLVGLCQDNISSITGVQWSDHWDGMLACYTGKRSYTFHLDNPRGGPGKDGLPDNGLRLTACYYLSPTWSFEENGSTGGLDLYVPSGREGPATAAGWRSSRRIRLAPHADTLAVFVSDRVAHQVVETNSQEPWFCLWMWFFDEPGMQAFPEAAWTRYTTRLSTPVPDSGPAPVEEASEDSSSGDEVIDVLPGLKESDSNE